MKFDEITKGVQDAWAFSVPPLVQCAIVYGVANYFNPEATSRAAGGMLHQLQAMGIYVSAARSALEPYGLVSLIPIVSFIAVIAFLFILAGPILSACGRLPPLVFFRPDVRIAQAATEKEILLVMRRFPASSFSDAYHLAELALFPMGDGQNLFFRNSGYGKAQAVVKFAGVTGCVIAIVNVRAGLPIGVAFSKELLLLLVAAAAWVVVTLGFLYEIEQAIFNEWYAIRMQLQTGSDVLKEPESPEEASARHAAWRHKNRWWGISFGSRYRLSWLRSTLWQVPREP